MSEPKQLTADELACAFFCMDGRRMEPDADGVYKVGITEPEQAIRGHIAALEARVNELEVDRLHFRLAVKDAISDHDRAIGLLRALVGEKEQP